MRKILFVNDEMTTGGVSRILNNLLGNLDLSKYEIDLLVLNPRGDMMKEVPEGINIIEGTRFFNTIDLNLKSLYDNKENKLLVSKLRLLFYMKTGLINNRIKSERKKMLKKHYDVEISAKEGFCSVFVANGDSDIKLNWVHVDYKQSNYSRNHMTLVKNALEKFNLNVACSNQARDSYKEVFSIDNVITINNLQNTERVISLSKEATDFEVDEGKFNMITVARFHPQKALDRLIRIYAKMLENNAECTLTIIGDGELHDTLYQLAEDLNVFDKINWLGMQSNPFKYMKKADAFVMSSLYEGYPTTVIESLLCGLPVITTHVAGVDEQLTEKHYGEIVANNEEALYEGLSRWNDDLENIREYRKKLGSYVYHNEEIIAKFCKLFDGEINE